MQIFKQVLKQTQTWPTLLGQNAGGASKTKQKRQLAKREFGGGGKSGEKGMELQKFESPGRSYPTESYPVVPKMH